MVFVPYSAGGDTVNTTVFDNSLREGNPDWNDGVRGYVQVDGGTGIFRALLSFPDFATSLPSGAVVDSGYFRLYNQDNWTSENHGLYRVLAPWTEGNLSLTSVDASGEYGASWNRAQEIGAADSAGNLNGAISASATTIVFDGISGAPATDLPGRGMALIESEIITYTTLSATGDTLSGVTRGQAGTTAASHSDNVAINFEVDWTDVGATDGANGGGILAQRLDSVAPAANATYYNWYIDAATGQAWVDSPSVNFGVLLHNYTGNGRSQFRTKEHTETPQRPVFNLYYHYTSGGNPADAVAPSPVTAVSVTPRSHTVARVTWTPSVSSDADLVWIRYSQTAFPANILEGTSAAKVPNSAGIYHITGLNEGAQVWVSVFSGDEVPNWSDTSVCSGGVL